MDAVTTEHRGGARMLTEKFRCPECGSRLRLQAPELLVCAGCAETIKIHDGIADFVRGRFDTALDADHYDGDHGIDEGSSSIYYDRIRALAGARWPYSLGSVVEIGCGTGLFSRALIESGDATDIMLTDVSVPMLRSCVQMLARLSDVRPAPIGFATYSSHENCFRDAVFDTCIGTSALHHIPDVAGFLADIFRGLKIGGRAFFLEPNQRFDRAFGQTLADVMAILHSRDSAWSEDRQRILNILAESRRRLLHQGDIAFLSSIEDKHMFLSEEFEDMALSLGFDAAEALPFSSDRTGIRTLHNLCKEIGTSDNFANEITDLFGAVGSRYFDLLSPRDAAPGFLLWATKRAGPTVRIFNAPAPKIDSEEAYSSFSAGGIAPQWAFSLKARQTPTGVVLDVSGWCIAHVDIVWVRIVLDGVAQQAPVWLPRVDVQTSLNTAGFYAAWGALCAGVESELTYPGLRPATDTPTLRVEIVLSGGAIFGAGGPSHLPLGETIAISG